MISLRVPLLIAAGLAVTASLWWREHARRLGLSRRWRERPAVAAETFLQGGAVKASGPEVERFRRIVAEVFALDPRRLHPADQLREDLDGDRLSRQRQLFFVARLERDFAAVLPPVETCFKMTAGQLFAAVIAGGQQDVQ